MPMQTVKGGAWLPSRPPHLNAALAFATTLAVSSTNNKAAFIIQSPKTDIAKVGVYLSSVAGSGTASVRLESLDASGSLVHANGTGTLSFSAAGWQTATLGGLTPIAKGTSFAIVVGYVATNFTLAAISSTACAEEFPYCTYFTGSWAKNQNCPVCALEYSGGSYEVVQGAWPIKAINNIIYNNGGTNQRGLRFKVPFPSRVTGAWIWAQISGDVDLKLYEEQGSGPVQVASLPIDKDYHQGATYGRQVYYFPQDVPVVPGRVYYLTLNPTTGTSITLNEVEVNSAALMDAMDGGQDFHGAERAGFVAFTTTPTKRLMMGVIFDQFADSTLGYIDVTMPPYEAKGDGTTDDTTAIQDALTDAVSASDGTTVFLPEGTYIVNALSFSGSNKKITGDGTLKLKAASSAAAVLTVSGSYNDLSQFRIDGNTAGSPSGTGSGLVVTGTYNRVRDTYVTNTKVASSSAAYDVGGVHNLLERTWAETVGGIAYKESGDFNRYRNIYAKNWGEAGFKRTVASPDKNRIDIDGLYFETGSMSTDNSCIVFDGGSGTTKMVVIRNAVVDWSEPSHTGSPLLAKFARIDQLIIDNGMFRHANAEATVEIGANVKRAYFDHTFLSRQLKLTSLDAKAIIMLVDTQIGDDSLGTSGFQPTLSVVGIDGAQFVARSCRFIGYSDAALEVVTNLNTDTDFVHFEASDTEFKGYNVSVDTYDVKVGAGGAVNASRKILWLNNRRSVAGGGPGAAEISTPDLRVLFTTRDWSKQVYQHGSSPSLLTGITWAVGDIVMNKVPANGGTIGWVCTNAAGAGTWKTFGPIQA